MWRRHWRVTLPQKNRARPRLGRSFEATVRKIAAQFDPLLLDSARAAVAETPKSPLDCILVIDRRSAIMDSVLARVALCGNCRYHCGASVHRSLSSPFLLCVARRVYHERLVRRLPASRHFRIDISLRRSFSFIYRSPEMRTVSTPEHAHFTERSKRVDGPAGRAGAPSFAMVTEK